LSASVHWAEGASRCDPQLAEAEKENLDAENRLCNRRHYDLVDLCNSCGGQDDCLASFQVNRSKSLTYLLIGPNASDRKATTTVALSQGEIRDGFYVIEKMTDPNLLSEAKIPEF
jgi:hypothetical protein